MLRYVAPLWALAALTSLFPMSASAATFRTIYSFCAEAQCADGKAPVAPLVMDAAGNLYGTTTIGGDPNSNAGVLFELVPNARHTKWKYKKLHNFCEVNGCEEGAVPTGSLIVDHAGNLYGTTTTGGVGESGAVFELLAAPGHGGRKVKVLHTFCPNGTNGCVDGQKAIRGLSYAGQASGSPYDGVSPLYGTTFNGGAFKDGSGVGEGTAFSLTPVPGKEKWAERIIYNFCGNRTGCATRLPNPSSNLAIDDAGNLYGIANQDNGFLGSVFKLKPKGRHGEWSETTLYEFCAVDFSCPDGSNPHSDTAFMDTAGNLYGTTQFGGAHDDTGPGGNVFKLETKTKQLTTLYDFCAMPNCTDGQYSTAGLVMDSAGNLYGTATGGGPVNEFSEGSGVVFRISGGSYQVLYAFCAETNCTDGRVPLASLIIAPWGALYGTTNSWGGHNGGTVFEIVP